MLKNNKILKAQMGAAIGIAEGLQYVLPAVAAALGLSQLNKDNKYINTQSPSTQWKINEPTSLAERTLPYVKSYLSNIPSNVSSTLDNVYSAVSNIPSNVSSVIPYRRSLFTYTLPKTQAELRARETAKQQQFWNDKATFYKQKLADGPIMLPNGNVITAYNPDTKTISGYSTGANGDRVFVDKNLQTGVYSNPVYKDAKTGAYYEGTLDLNGDIPLVGPGENLMPYSIIPVEKPKWIVSNPSDILKLTIPVVFKKNKPESKQTSSEVSEKATVNPKSPNEEDKENNNSDKDNNNSNKDYNEKGYKQSPVEEWMNEFPEKVNAYRRWRIGNSKDVWHNKSGNISWDGTKLLNRGVTPTNTGQSPSLWGTRLKWGIGGATGGAIGYGIYSSWNNKSNDSQKPELDGTIETVNEAIKQTSNTPNNFSNISNNANYNMIADPNQYNYD